ncbi:hypothetical protein ACFY93_23665 [Streptomyces sp. NPDC008313]|uniref:hypothetical protein n=1 Tax=Streptomyces sp. NPDC008313 TaxID=3364826 RepID=UPI0036F0E7A6
MLTSVDTHWLWLMATAAGVIHCYAMATWIPLPKFWRVYPFIWVLCGALMAPVGGAMGIPLPSMLVMYAFALTGLTIGMFPTRKLFAVWAAEIDEGTTRETYDYPRSHLAWLAVSVLTLLLTGFALTR